MDGARSAARTIQVSLVVLKLYILMYKLKDF